MRASPTCRGLWPSTLPRWHTCLRTRSLTVPPSCSVPCSGIISRRRTPTITSTSLLTSSTTSTRTTCSPPSAPAPSWAPWRTLAPPTQWPAWPFAGSPTRPSQESGGPRRRASTFSQRWPSLIWRGTPTCRRCTMDRGSWPRWTETWTGPRSMTRTTPTRLCSRTPCLTSRRLLRTSRRRGWRTESRTRTATVFLSGLLPRSWTFERQPWENS
mmetsp:Transcript_26977/g.62133  ORF Transcript_26977/g.62133 Transcript_26977/m.62133 type:complete len:213 (-) Transcript_26977:1077-1715(-)